jgi:hypothetical protein
LPGSSRRDGFKHTAIEIARQKKILPAALKRIQPLSERNQALELRLHLESGGP